MPPPAFVRPKLFRYSEHQWLIRSLMLGEFRLVPASYYGELLGDSARHDNELVRENAVPGEKVTITHVATGRPIKAIGDVVFRDEVGTNYYTLSFSSAFDPFLFDEFAGSNACLVIHEPEEVCERIHFYAEQFLQRWSGIDGAVAYGREHKYGPTFVKDWRYIVQKEWRFAWMPPEKADILPPFCIQIGNIERYAEIVPRPSEKVSRAG
ncbi:hypothetical protein [Dechloromonas sp. CZR5]|uniref:hypothetical protein n=1 Tax=Dechloromonas sp. CZR5 TaxID=2608630 RepID=UPI00123CE67E|nr:hypothetical protein [Dechloromonas sp. CZR5]